MPHSLYPITNETVEASLSRSKLPRRKGLKGMRLQGRASGGLWSRNVAKRQKKCPE